MMFDWTMLLTQIAGVIGGAYNVIRGPLAALLLGIGTCVGTTACQGTGKDGGVTTQDAQAFLQDGKFKGNGRWSQGGAPISAGMKNVFWLGPESAVFEFDGSFDFTDKPEAMGPK